MPDELFRALIAIAFGSLAGGLTNSVAIWMLFHPYEAPTLGRRDIKMLQGAIPKNQARLAAAVGRTVGTRLLTEEDLGEIFSDQEFRTAFNGHLSGFLDALLHQEQGSVRDLFPERMHEKIEVIVEDVATYGLDRLHEYLQSERFAETVTARAGDIVQSIADEPIAGLLTSAREGAISEAVDEWITGAVESEDFSQAIDDYLDRAARRLLEPDRTFQEVLPLGLVGAVEKGIAAYLPLAIERLGSLLEDKEARAKFEGFVHDLLHRFLGDLKFHQRVVAKLIITESTVDMVLDTIEADGAERLTEMLQEEAMQDAMAGEINDAIVDFLRRPVTSVLGDPDDPSVVDARDTVVGWFVGLAQDPASRSFIVEKLEGALGKMGARTWGEVFEKLPPDRVAEWLVAGARSEPAATLFRESANRLSKNILERPIGTPSDWLPTGAARTAEETLGDPIWEWLQTQVPDVVQQIDVAGRVEEKVLAFPPARMEELVKKVTHKELKIIVRLGYLLGGIIGMALWVMDSFFS